MIRRPAPVWWDDIGQDALPGYLDEHPNPAPARSLLDLVRIPDNSDSGPSHSFANPLPLQPLAQRRPHVLSTSFVRAFEVSFEDAAERLERWWHSAEREGRVALGHSYLTGAPVREPNSGRCRIEVSLRRGIAWPPLPMDLDLVPWFATFGTKIALRPRRILHPSRLYFASGHAVLDSVIAKIRQETASRAVAPL